MTTAVIVVLLCAVAWLANTTIYEWEYRKNKSIFRPWPIPRQLIEDFDPRFKTGLLGPDRSTEIKFISSYRVEGGIDDFESWILCNLAKDAQNIFEFGTCTGKTTYLLAANSSPDTRITTITLDPNTFENYKSEKSDDVSAKISAMNESRFADFLYSGSEESNKITQLFGDSKVFDHSPYQGKFDLIFVDGSHAQSYVESDSDKAMEMLKDRGVIIWHDYRGPRRTKGVFRTLNRIGRRLPLVHIAGTTFVAYRKD